MVARIKKIINCILLISCFIYISSCTLPSISIGKKYKITYIHDGEILEHEPSTYISGTFTELVDLDVSGFIGWYTTPDFSGKAVKEIDIAKSGDLTFYAKVESDKPVEEYEITYIYSGKIIEHSPKTYISGQTIKLVDLDVTGFIGWYTTPDFSGNKITEIDKNKTGNITLYAKVEEVINPTINLEDVFNSMQNYAYTYSYVSLEADDSYVSYNEYYNGNIKQSGYDYYDEYFEDFLVNDNGNIYIYTKDYDGKYGKISEDDIYFDSYYSLFDIVKFHEIDSSLFTLVNGYYELIDKNNINSIGKILLGDFEGDIYTDLKIEVKDNVVSKILAKSMYTYSGYSYEYDYEVIFSNHNNVYFELPKIDGEISSTQTIKEVHEAYDDTTVITKGYVCGIVGNNIYIQDDTAGVYLYLGSNSSVTPYLNLGDEIVVEGIKTTYKGLVEINDITSIDVTGYNKNLTKNNIEVLEENILSPNLCKLVDINNLTIVDVESDYLSSTNDVNITISDGANTIDLFISKHIDSATKASIFVDNIKVGDKINLENVVVGYFNKYQIVVTSSSKVEKVNSGVIIPDTTVQKAPSDTTKLSDILPTLGVENGEVYGVSRGLPSIGSPQILVIPISFTDYPAPNTIQKDLEKAFFGTSNDTGWESLKSYYYKTSYGKLNISGTVLPAYNTNKSSSYYEYLEEGDYLFIKDALEYYDGIIDYSDYDYDQDGYIDSLYFVYTCPYSYDDNSLYWAYTYEYYTDDFEYYDNVEADFYILASYHFLFDTLANGKKITYNTETYIHETGHLLGLDDYYDYDENIGPYGGIGGGDMMDYNIGDNNPFSKIILGWTTPYLVQNTSTKLTLSSFESSGDVVMIPKSFNGTYFDEYYLIDFYTPTGLNELEAGHSGLFGVSGIRIYHIDATLKDPTEAWTVWEIYKYNNSDTDHKLIKLIEADNNNHIENLDYGYSEDSDLFQKGMSYSNSKWYNGTSTNFTINVLNIYSDRAEIEIIFK